MAATSARRKTDAVKRTLSLSDGHSDNNSPLATNPVTGLGGSMSPNTDFALSSSPLSVLGGGSGGGLGIKPPMVAPTAAALSGGDTDSVFDVRSAGSSRAGGGNINNALAYHNQYGSGFVPSSGTGGILGGGSGVSAMMAATQGNLSVKQSYQERRNARWSTLQRTTMTLPSARLAKYRMAWEAKIDSMSLSIGDTPAPMVGAVPTAAVDRTEEEGVEYEGGKKATGSTGEVVVKVKKGATKLSSKGSKNLTGGANIKKLSGSTTTASPPPEVVDGVAKENDPQGSRKAPTLEVVTARRDLLNELQLPTFEAYLDVELGKSPLDRWAHLLSRLCVLLGVSATKLLQPLPPTGGGGGGGASLMSSSGTPMSATSGLTSPISPTRHVLTSGFTAPTALSPRGGGGVVGVGASGMHVPLSGALGFLTSYGRRIKTIREEARLTVDTVLPLLRSGGIQSSTTAAGENEVTSPLSVSAVSDGAAGTNTAPHSPEGTTTFRALRRDEYCLLEAGGNHEFERWCAFLGKFSLITGVPAFDLLAGSSTSVQMKAPVAYTDRK